MERIGADCSPGFTEVRQYKSHVGNIKNYDNVQLEDFPNCLKTIILKNSD